MKQFFFTILYQPLYNLLIFLAWLTPGHSIGWAIVFLTVITRFILLPTSLKAAYLQVKNFEIQPKVNKLRAEIKDPQEQSKAIMALYKEEGHSPFGSCLPMLIQLPILIVLFTVFKNGLTVEGFSALYSFMPRMESINTMFLGFDLTNPDPWVLPIIAAGIQLWLSFLMMPKNMPLDKNDPMAAMNKQMIYLPAIMTILFGRSMPSALVIYWIVTTLFSLFLQLYVNKNIKNKKSLMYKIEKEVDQETKEKAKKAGKKPDLMAKMMQKRLDKAEKKADVTIKVREKKK